MDYQILYLPIVDSTQTYAKKKSFLWENDRLTCVCAAIQTNAYGTNGKKWYGSQPNNLYATCYFSVRKNIEPQFLGQIMALSIAQVLEKKSVVLEIKWPNDLLLQEKKCAGVLTEIFPKSEYWEVFLGLGVNLCFTKDILKKIDQPATCLQTATKRLWNAKNLLPEIVEQFLLQLECFLTKGAEPIQKQLDAYWFRKNRPFSFHDGKTIYEGIFLGVCPQGKLRLQDKNGTIHTFFSGTLTRKDRPE